MYKVKDDEVAVVIKPVLDDDGNWNYELKTGITFGNELEKYTGEAGHAMLDAAISMAAALAYIQDYPDMLDMLDDYKHDMLAEIFPDQYAQVMAEQEAEEGYEKEDNVIRLNRWTKTQGNA